MPDLEGFDAARWSATEQACAEASPADLAGRVGTAPEAESRAVNRELAGIAAPRPRKVVSG